VPPSGGGGLRDFLDMLNPVILTAADVMEVAEQVPGPDAPVK
jgi:hypothetical protein